MGTWCPNDLSSGAGGNAKGGWGGEVSCFQGISPKVIPSPRLLIPSHRNPHLSLNPKPPSRCTPPRPPPPAPSPPDGPVITSLRCCGGRASSPPTGRTAATTPTPRTPPAPGPRSEAGLRAAVQGVFRPSLRPLNRSACQPSHRTEDIFFNVQP